MSRPRFASFAIALPLYRVFEYSLDDDSLPVAAGTRYRLPFGNRTRTGVLLNHGESSEIDPARIKPVLQRLDPEPVLDAHMMSLARWVADYYRQPLGEVVFLCLPGQLRGARQLAPTRVKRWKLAAADPEEIEELRRRAPRQHEIYAALQARPAGLTALELKQINPNWHGAVKALEARRMVAWDWDEGEAEAPPPTAARLPRLSPEQSGVMAEIEPRLNEFGVHLLDGITGSGKTEIYLRLIQSRLEAGLQVIYLVPEIGLTGQLLERVRQRFGGGLALSHSGLTDAQRYRAWDRFRRGEARIMLGTRSSLFSQCERLGLIVVDEEHDQSYRQQDGVRYQARDVAIKRAQMLGIPIVLGSATPSLESLHNCERGTYFRYRIDHRPTRYPPPRLDLLDVRDSRLDYGCSSRTLTLVERHLARGGQVLIYLNRRGYAPVVMCHECGWQALCRNCDARLTLHQSVNCLLCHHCGYRAPIPAACPECDNPEIRQHGVGTEQLEQGLNGRFPDTPVLRVDRDVVASRESLGERLQQLRGGAPCILIGTQMIAKGHDYPAITLAVVLDADQALFSASYRASERLVQTLFQVSGRSGRGDREGEAVVQTRFPEHPLMRALGRRSYREIAADLLQERRSYGFPPYAKVVMFRADAVELKDALEMLEQIKTLLAATSRFSALDCIGPLPALMTRRVNRYRAQLCLMSRDYRLLRAVLDEAMPAIEELPGTPRANWAVDVDAYDL
ncbi:MAG: primosomal protein N' [Gammaproteobacteria bacterium]